MNTSLQKMERAFQIIYFDRVELAKNNGYEYDELLEKMRELENKMRKSVLRLTPEMFIKLEKKRRKSVLSLTPDIIPESEMFFIRKSLQHYMEGGYVEINSGLYSQYPSERVLDLTEFILKAMLLFRPFRLTEPFVVYRGITGKHDQEHESFLVPMIQRQGYMNRSYFTSTSLDIKKSLAYADTCLFEIHVDPKDNMDYIWLSAKSESEVLFEPYTHFIIKEERIIQHEGKNIPYFICDIKKGEVFRTSQFNQYRTSQFNQKDDLPPLIALGGRKRQNKIKRKTQKKYKNSINRRFIIPKV